jgi:hypothetical protein
MKSLGGNIERRGRLRKEMKKEIIGKEEGENKENVWREEIKRRRQ